MIYALSLHIAIDKYINVKSLNLNNTNYYHNINNIVGSKAVNVSKLVSQFTDEITLVSTTTKELLEDVNNELKDVNKKIFIDENSRVNYKLNDNGNVTEINQQVEPLSNSTKEDIKNYLIDNINQEDYLLVAGSFNKEDIDFILDLCKNVKTTNIIIDSSTLKIKELNKIQPLMIKPNEEEIDLFIEDDISVEQKIEKLNNLGIKDVFVTLGSRGVKYNNLQIIPPIKGKVINTVGAGDSFVAGYLISKLFKLDMNDLITFSQACGSATAYSESIANKEKVLDLLKGENVILSKLR